MLMTFEPNYRLKRATRSASDLPAMDLRLASLLSHCICSGEGTNFLDLTGFNSARFDLSRFDWGMKDDFLFLKASLMCKDIAVVE